MSTAEIEAARQLAQRQKNEELARLLGWVEVEQSVWLRPDGRRVNVFSGMPDWWGNLASAWALKTDLGVDEAFPVPVWNWMAHEWDLAAHQLFIAADSDAAALIAEIIVEGLKWGNRAPRGPVWAGTKIYLAGWKWKAAGGDD